MPAATLTQETTGHPCIQRMTSTIVEKSPGGTWESGAPDHWKNANAPTITLDKISLDKGTLRRCEPLALYPYLSSCQKYFTVHFDDIDMELTEISIEELQDAIESVLRIHWRTYAMGNSNEMTLEAQGLKNRLLSLYSHDPAK